MTADVTTTPPLVTIIIPAYNEEANVPLVERELLAVVDPLPYRFEFLFVDDGSSDGTAESLAGLRRGDERVRFLVLSRNFGHQAALSAGLHRARGGQETAETLLQGRIEEPGGQQTGGRVRPGVGHSEVLEKLRVAFDQAAPEPAVHDDGGRRGSVERRYRGAQGSQAGRKPKTIT